jgi:hypothetical protein
MLVFPTSSGLFELVEAVWEVRALDHGLNVSCSCFATVGERALWAHGNTMNRWRVVAVVVKNNFCRLIVKI